CLNLPLHLRYLEENMYLAGIGPGPKSPTGVQYNHLLGPVVDDFLESWDRGILVRKTCRHPQGLQVHCALIPVIVDMIGAKEILALAGVTSTHFCSYCDLPCSDINNLRTHEWEHRDVRSWRAAAERWRDAPTRSQRDAEYEESGIRWSELLRLPYFDPPQFLDTETMHLFNLRCIPTHCRAI
ncbi:hypothetical protein EXIGLDRAFT_563467, partial [Exidia glandulosa HHB12029]